MSLLQKPKFSSNTIERENNTSALRRIDHIYFVICNSCYWCASYSSIDNDHNDVQRIILGHKVIDTSTGWIGDVRVIQYLLTSFYQCRHVSLYCNFKRKIFLFKRIEKIT